MFGSESYPLEAFDSWMNVLDHPYVIGDFVWTAFDYVGEASIGWRGYWQEQNFYPGIWLTAATLTCAVGSGRNLITAMRFGKRSAINLCQTAAPFV